MENPQLTTFLSSTSLPPRLPTPMVGINTADESSSQLSDSLSSSTAEDEDDNLYGDRDDAQSMLQPAISPVATRLTSPWGPAAERAALMEEGRPRTRDILDGADDQDSRQTTPLPVARPATATPMSLGSLTPPDAQLEQFPTPWHPGPKEFVIDGKQGKSSIAGVFGGARRLHRSSSFGEHAMKRFSKAFPSITLPSGLLSNFTPPSFLSMTSDQSAGSTPGQRRIQKASTVEKEFSPAGTSEERPERPSATLRRTNSEDSTLYHSLSRVSSFGDDDRFTHVREQVNVRFKAIKDSWDAPTFKLPNLPNIIPDALKAPRSGSSDPSPPLFGSGSGSASNQRARADSSTRSALDSVLDSLTGDIVVLGGYRGSVLRSAQAPHRQLWVPVKVGLNIRKVNLEVGLEPEDEENMEKHIFASGMLQNIGPVDISKRLFKKLRECDNARRGLLRVHDFGYDWRLSPHLLSRKLVEFLEKLPSNQPGVPAGKRGALVIAHSLGGMITRHAVNQRPELFSGVLYAGVPQRCINILGPLRNGDAVLLNEKVLTAQVNFSLRTTFVFLPEDGSCFVDKDTGEACNIDFYNVDDWIKYRLCPCVSDPALPPLVQKANSSFGLPLRSLSGSLSALPLRGRSDSDGKKTHSPSRGPSHPAHDTLRKAEIAKDRTLAPQMPSSSSSGAADDTSNTAPTPPSIRARNIAYLTRTLAQTKLFRSQLGHDAAHAEANAYPPIAVLYGKEIPTVYAARVRGGPAGIPHADAYDDLVFRSGDGVVLARQAMPPPGYDIVRGGRVSTDRGHITMLGDMPAVGRALEAVVRGRRKGIGMGLDG